MNFTRPFPSSRKARLRRGSAAFTFLLLVLIGGIGFTGYVLWQDRERERIAQEAQAQEAAAKEAATPPKPSLAEGLPEIVITEKAPKPPEEPEVVLPPLPPLPKLTEQAALPRTGIDELVEGRNLLSTLSRSNYKFSPAIASAYIKYAKAKAIAESRALNKAIPADFLAWIDANPEIALTVYGTRPDPTNVLLRLRSLEIDAGREAVRSKYTQLALATAVVNSSDGEDIDVSTRPELKLTIPGDPRKPVDTKDPKRTLDMNDHIINFLNDHEPIQGDIVGGMKEALPELVYDSKGVATSYTAKKGKKSEPNKVKRKVIAADVLASRKLQLEFNAYMKSKGFDVNIDCGDHVIHPGLGMMLVPMGNNHPDGIQTDKKDGILEAYRMFKTAYEEKGLLARRDPSATPAERFAYILMNDKRLPKTYGNGKKVPSFPLTAPWPMLALLAADGQPLREREDLFERLKRGEFHTYGEYIGPIAQQYDLQSARRLAPYDFGYGSFQMMLKDGGVCGTMATMCVRSYNMANIPASTAGQPGHCALIFAAADGKKYTYKGGQYVTGGHDKTNPHMVWSFDGEDKRRPMYYHLSVPNAVNVSLRSFLESTVALRLYKELPEADREKYGLEFLSSALTHNPYNIAVAMEVLTNTTNSDTLVKLWQRFSAAVISNAAAAGETKDGGLYLKSVRSRMTDHLAKLPEPTDKNLAREAAKLIKQRADEVAAEAEEERKKAEAEAAKKAKA